MFITVTGITLHEIGQYVLAVLLLSSCVDHFSHQHQFDATTGAKNGENVSPLQVIKVTHALLVSQFNKFLISSSQFNVGWL